MILIAIPIGSTDSFGGGGGEHFGGYTGQVNHKDWSKYSVIPGNQSILNPDCKPIEGASAAVLQMMPGFFALGILFIGIMIIYNSSKKGGVF